MLEYKTSSVIMIYVLLLLLQTFCQLRTQDVLIEMHEWQCASDHLAPRFSQLEVR